MNYKSHRSMRERDNLTQVSIAEAQNQAVLALYEISNQQSKYQLDWTKKTVKGFLKKERYSYEVCKIRKQNFGDCHSLNKIKPSCKLPLLEKKIDKEDNEQNIQPTTNLIIRNKLKKRQNSQMNSVYGFIKYKNKSNRKAFIPSHLKTLQEKENSKNFDGQNNNVSLDQCKEKVSQEKFVPSICINREQQKKRIDTVKSWLKQKRNQCKSLNQIVNKYCNITENKTNIDKKSISKRGHKDDDKQNKEDLDENVGFRIKSFFVHQ